MKAIAIVFPCVTVIPKITKAPLDTNILSSGDVNFTCIAIGKPRATITWSRNTNTITNNIYKDIPGIIINSIVGNCTIDDPLSQCLSSSTLQITDAAAVDSGEYTCIATNKVGSNEKTAKLIVNGNSGLSVYTMNQTSIDCVHKTKRHDNVLCREMLHVYSMKDAIFTHSQLDCAWMKLYKSFSFGIGHFPYQM